MPDVFISYSRKDAAFVRDLHAALAKEGRDAWIDWEDIPPTADWLAEVFGAIEAADTVVFVLSPDSLASKVCIQELTHAEAQRKRLVPIVRRDVAPADVPTALATLNWVFFREGDDFAAAFRTLLQALDTDLERTKAHTRLLVRALEWERRDENASFLLRGQNLRDAEELLAAGLDSPPSPTPLQRRYVLAGRRAASRGQRQRLGAVSVALVVALALAAIAWGQRSQAVAQRREAQAQRNVAVARQLAAQSSSLTALQPGLQPVAIALAIEAMRRHPSIEADQALRAAAAVLPVQRASLPHSGVVEDAVFSPDGRYLATAGYDRTVRLWNPADGTEIARWGLSWPALRLAFSADGTRLAAAASFNRLLANERPPDDRGAIAVWEVPSGREVALLRGPSLVEVHAVAVSAKGTHLAAVDGNNDIHLWDLSTGEELIHGRAGGMAWDLVFSPDGRYIVIAVSTPAGPGIELGDGGALRILQVGSKEMRLIHRQPTGVRRLALSTDGRYLAWSSFFDDAVRLLDLAKFPTEPVIVAHGAQVNDLAFSADGKYLATGGEDRSARVWDVATAREVARLPHAAPVQRLALSPDGRYVAAADGAVSTLWAVADGRELARVVADRLLGPVAFSTDGATLVTGGERFTARLIEVSPSGTLAQRAALEGQVAGVDVSADGRLVVAVGGGKGPQVWEAETGRQVAVLRGESETQYSSSAVFLPDGERLLTLDIDIARLWAVAGGRLLRSFKVSGSDVAFLDRDGRRLAAGGWGGAGSYYDIESGRAIAGFEHAGIPVTRSDQDSGRIHRRFALSPDGLRAATTGNDRTVRLWDAQAGRELHRFELPAEAQLVAFSADSTRLAASLADHTARVWEVQSGREIAALADGSGPREVGPTDHAAAIALSPDGRRLAMASRLGLGAADSDRLAHVWEIDSGRIVARLAHESHVVRVAFAPDGRHLATASSDFSVRIWEVASGQEVARWNHDGVITALRFTPDGRRLVSGSLDRTARATLWRPADMIAAACARLTRNLSEDEWRRYVGEEPYRATCEGAP